MRNAGERTSQQALKPQALHGSLQEHHISGVLEWKNLCSDRREFCLKEGCVLLLSGPGLPDQSSRREHWG